MASQEARPARKQVDKPITELEDSNDTSQYNIWSHRKLKGFRTPREGRGTKQKSEYRCRPKLDCGWTRGSKSGCGYCCLYFARGICHHGQDCNYLHRVPTEADELRHREPQYDIFGRDRLAEERGTKGVGSYNRQCTTLYIYLGGAATHPVETLNKALTTAFFEWGPLEDVRAVPAKAIAFVRYKWRASAEFAKAAMHQQTLGLAADDAVLDVRWANDDPNPRAQRTSRRQQEESLAQAYLDAVETLHPDAKRAKLHSLTLTASYVPGAAASSYPDTSAQYGNYEGWDARAYAEAEAAAAATGDEEKNTDRAIRAQEVAVKQHDAVVAGKPVRVVVEEVEEDDISRYLMPGDVLVAEAVDTEVGGVGDGGRAGGHSAPGGAAEEALGLIGGYGSDSE